MNKKQNLLVIVLGIITIISLLFSFFVGYGASNLIENVANTLDNCSNFCEQNNQYYFLSDPVSNSCQCYDENNQPTYFNNFD